MIREKLERKRVGLIRACRLGIPVIGCNGDKHYPITLETKRYGTLTTKLIIPRRYSFSSYATSIGFRYPSGVIAYLIRSKLDEAKDARRLPSLLNGKITAGKFGKRVAGVYETSGLVERLWRQKMSTFVSEVAKAKKPLSVARHVGIEIEFITPKDISRRDIALSLGKEGLQKHCQLKSDASVKGDPDEDSDCSGDCRDNCECYHCGDTHRCTDLDECRQRCREQEDIPTRRASLEMTRESWSCPGHYCQGQDDHPDFDCNCECDCTTSSDQGHELALVCSEYRLKKVLKRTTEVLLASKASVNSTCGLHVHIDMRKRDAATAFHNLVTMQRLLYSMVPKTRYENRYCQPNGSKDMRNYNDRYYGINPQSWSRHKTIEVRLHSGTISYDKIINFVSLLIAIVDAPKIEAPIETLEELQSYFGLSQELVGYIAARLVRFKEDHGSYSWLVYRTSVRTYGTSPIETRAYYGSISENGPILGPTVQRQDFLIINNEDLF